MHRNDLVHERCACLRVPSDPAQGPRPFQLPGDREHHGRARPFEPRHVRVDLRLDVPTKSLTAEASITVARRDPAARTLHLDAVALDVESVTVRRPPGAAPTPAKWSYDGERLAVDLRDLAEPQEAVVTVRYRATPTRGLYFLAPEETAPDRPTQVWTQGQDEDTRRWIPCVDEPGVRHPTEVIAHVPAGWRVISNGRLVAHDTLADGERWHWSQEDAHPPYLVTLVAGTFAEVDASAEAGLPCRYYVDPGREDDARRTFGETPSMLRYFEKLTGVAYPWAKYDQVAVHGFTFGGMENTSATTMTERMLLDARAALDVSMHDLVAHELAHQWFGDLVTCRDWSHAWLNEGFATFMEHVDVERREGRDAALFSIKDHLGRYLAEDGGRYRRPLVCASWSNPIDLFDAHLYEKGGLVLHMLRAELGDALFWRAVGAYLERHRGRAVETRDLLRALEDATGRSLEAFFDQWVYRAGHPDVEVDASHDADASLVTVTVRQTQPVDAVTALFRFTLAVEVVTDEGAQRHDLDVREASQTFHLRVASAPRYLAVDPDATALMRLTQKLPSGWFVEALARAPQASVRWRAAAALARVPEAKVVEALGRGLAADAFWGVSVECARALGELATPAAFEALSANLSAKHPKVRRAVVAALGRFRTDAAAEALLALLARGDASYLVEAESARALGHTRRPRAYDALAAALERPSWRDVVRAGVIDGLAALRDERALAAVEPFAARGNTYAARRAAVNALAELGASHRVTRELLESFLDEDDPAFTPDVIHALVTLGDDDVRGAIGRCVERTTDPRVRRIAREAARDLAARDRGDEARKVRDELTVVRDEVRALREELSKLRATTNEAKPPKRPAKRVRSAKAPATARKTSRSR